MSDPKNSLEPWSVVEAMGLIRLRGTNYEYKAEDDCIVDANGVEVLGSSERLRGVEHLPRIVACVNACIGLSDEQLNALSAIGGIQQSFKNSSITGAQFARQLFNSDQHIAELQSELAAARAEVERLRLDARRYRRLQVLGCAPNGSKQLENSTVLCFSGLDEFVDADLKIRPHRGEANPIAVTATPSQREEVEPVIPLGLRSVATELLQCFEAWEPMVCVLGNVRARDGATLMRAILNNPSPEQTTPPAPAVERIEVDGVSVDAEWVRKTRGRIDELEGDYQRLQQQLAERIDERAAIPNIEASDHPDLIGGMVWTAHELDWIRAYGQRCVKAALSAISQPPSAGDTRHLYNELLFAVSQKFPNETRHETALRYIRQAESVHDSRPAQPAGGE